VGDTFVYRSVLHVAVSHCALVIWGSDDTVDKLAAGRASARALDAPLVVITRFAAMQTKTVH